MTSVLANPCRVLENPGRDRKKKKNYDTIFGIAIEIQIGSHHQLRRQDWAQIGADLLEYILKMLPLADILRCRGVCTWWRCVTKTYLSISINSLPKPYPPLIIWETDFSGDGRVSWRFFDVLKTDGGGNLYLPNTNSQELLGQMGRCVGSSSSSNGGYLLFLDGVKEDSLYLFHPLLFSGSALHLLVSGDPYGALSISKAVLWGDPISDSSYYGLVVLDPCYRPPLFAKCGATQFTPLQCRGKEHFVDIVCVKNRIYGLTDDCNFNVWDCTGCIGSSSGSHVPRLVLEFEAQFRTPHRPSSRWGLHLVEWDGEILLVVAKRPKRSHLKCNGGTITSFNKIHPICEVYKMHFNSKEWERIYSLGDRVLFVTELQSMALSSLEFPKYQRNSIYYWHSLPLCGEDPCLGIFNMEDGSLKLIDAELG